MINTVPYKGKIIVKLKPIMIILAVLLALGLLDQARDVDLRNPHQDFFDPIWRQGWRAGDLIQIGTGTAAAGSPDQATEASRPDQAGVAS